MKRISVSLRFRMALVFGAVLATIAIFMLVYFPARMGAQAQASAEQRALAITRVMATALGPAIEFDDADNASAILNWLATMPDTRFGVAHRANGSQLAAWEPSRIPADRSWDRATTTQFVTRGEHLVVSVPVAGLGGGKGFLHVGFSLAALEVERTATVAAVGEVTALVFVIGVLAILILATVLVRPIHRLTSVARQIARGELPPQLPAVKGSDEVAQMADSFRVMLDRLNEVNQQLMVASRHAGMAEVATGVLHDVGNVLTSVNVSAELMHERTREIPVARMRRLREFLPADGSLSGDRLVAMARFVELVGDELERNRDRTVLELANLRTHLEHIKRVVAMQNMYARAGGVIELVTVATMIDEAVSMGCPDAGRLAITVALEVEPITVPLDRHRILQILVNLIKNARDAAVAGPAPRAITVVGRIAGGALRLTVSDSGAGIAPADRTRVFAAGFTTKANGHGYGLHSSALAARQLGATLAVVDGAASGATFELVIPTRGAA